jgi:hypothetical protein
MYFGISRCLEPVFCCTEILYLPYVQHDVVLCLSHSGLHLGYNSLDVFRERISYILSHVKQPK